MTRKLFDQNKMFLCLMFYFIYTFEPQYEIYKIFGSGFEFKCYDQYRTAIFIGCHFVEIFIVFSKTNKNNYYLYLKK